MRWSLGLVSIVALVALGGCSSGPQVPQDNVPEPPASPSAGSDSASSGSSAAGHSPDHVLVAIFENKDFAQINGNTKAPYLNQLMRTSAAVMVNAHGVAHPSQPNYLALFSGSTQGVGSDKCFDPLPGRANLGSQLIAAGKTFTGYSEDLPDIGYTGCTSGGYAAKHNPWVHFANLPVTV